MMTQCLDETSSGDDRRPIRVLLIEDNPVDARFLGVDFRKGGAGNFDLISIRRLSEAESIIREMEIDVILLDLFLEESKGLETLSFVRRTAPDIPVVVLTGLNDEGQALVALRHGAQDYLIKGNADSSAVFRAIRYAVERKHAETTQRRLEEKLLESQKLQALGTLAGGVAHNFNNTLMVILGHTSLMLDTDCDADTRRHIHAIEKAADRAAGVTRQLLAFGQRQPAEMTITNLNKVITDMEPLLESMISKDIQLDFQLSNDIGFVKCDPGRIQQAVINLMLNARDAMGSGGRITIKTEATVTSDLRSKPAPGQQQVRLTVTDNGCGMPEETLEHLFEPFFTTKGLTQANGLGLSAVHGIVEQHGGTVMVSSVPGAGTTVSIALPVFKPTGGC
jgi:two-component system, cell cycle sensor histidine kinase and response regulator CckA